MAQPIILPKLGQMVEESTITRWLKQEGDRIEKGDVLFEMETDKSLMEVESFFEGTLIKIVVPAGQAIPVMKTVAYVGHPGETVPEIQTAEPPAAPSDTPEPATPLSSLEQTQKTNTTDIFRISPRAAKLARETAIDPAFIAGTGPGGRVVERDVKAYLATNGMDQTGTPTAKRPATVEQTDAVSAAGIGDRGEGMAPDVDSEIAGKPKLMTKMRQVIAQRLSDSYRAAPHFFVTVAVDMTDLVSLRQKLKTQGINYTFSDFILKSVALTLAEFPLLNSTTDGKRIWWHRRINLGLAVSLEQGLVVPVIRGAEQLSLKEIHDWAFDLVERARAGKLTPDEMAGSTFTISNMGMFDVENFTAIINPGESGILAVSSITEQAAVRQHEIVIRSLMKITLSGDHRIIDGTLAANFINTIKKRLEDAALWKRLIS